MITFSKVMLNMQMVPFKYMDFHIFCLFLGRKVMIYEMEGSGIRANNDEAAQAKTTESGIVYFEGALINIKQSIEHQNAMEKERQEVKDKNDQLELQLGVTGRGGEGDRSVNRSIFVF